MRKDYEKTLILKRNTEVLYWCASSSATYWLGIFSEVVNNSDSDKCLIFLYRICCLPVNGVCASLVNGLPTGFLLTYIKP